MLQIKKFQIYILFISIILNVTLSDRLPDKFLSSWGEKIIHENNKDFQKALEVSEKYFVSDGYDLNDYDIIPFGFFKQTVNGTKFRLLFAVKKKSGDSPTIFDIKLNKAIDGLKVISTKKPDYSSSSTLAEKSKKKMKNSIMKYYFKNLYRVGEIEVEYEYHEINGLNDYAIYDVSANLNNKTETVEARLLIVYRNDKTFTVEKELKANNKE